jgi:hypothetical protein
LIGLIVAIEHKPTDFNIAIQQWRGWGGGKRQRQTDPNESDDESQLAGYQWAFVSRVSEVLIYEIACQAVPVHCASRCRSAKPKTQFRLKHRYALNAQTPQSPVNTIKESSIE